MKSYHMTTADVSVSVDLPRSSVYNAARVKGSLPNVKLGGRLYFAPEDVRNWNHKRLNAKPFNVDTAEPIGGGQNGYRDPETNKLMGQTIRPGYWTAFGYAIWLQCKREEDENTPFGTLRYRMRDKALPVLRILAEADEEPTPLNKFKKKGFFRSLFSV
tara:strand:- start:71 stop:547 length:477 start_codon:yes stop_codon:yes gene_type:complete